MLDRFCEDDIKDLFTNFIDRLNVRKYIADKTNGSISKSNSISSTSSCDDSMEFDSDATMETCSNPVQKEKTSGISSTMSTGYDVTQMIEKKGLRKKANKEQKCFTSLLKDAAVAAHIWQKALKLSDIPGRKRDAFF